MILMTGHFCVFVFPRNQSLTVKVQGHWTAKTSSCSLFSGRMMHIAHKTGKHFPKTAAFFFFFTQFTLTASLFQFDHTNSILKKLSKMQSDWTRLYTDWPNPSSERLKTAFHWSIPEPSLSTVNDLSSTQQQWPLLMSRWPLKVKGLGQLQSTSEQMENCDGLQINLLSSSLYPDQTSALPYMPFSHSNTSKLLKRLYL